MSSLPTLDPIQKIERIVSLDIIRAMALFGVLLMNFPDFSGADAMEAVGRPLLQGKMDTLLKTTFSILVHTKAMGCFAMLFGIGLFIQFERASARGIRPIPFAIRRLGSLFLIGVAHYICIWDGDILAYYALVGFSLLFFLKAKPRIFLLAIAAFLTYAELVPAIVSHLHLDPRLNHRFWNESILRSGYAIYGNQAWVACAKWRASYWQSMYLVSECLFVVPFILPYFLVGALFWRMGLPKEPRVHAATLTRLFHGTLWLGLAICLATADPFKVFPKVLKEGYSGIPWRVVGLFGNYALAVGYFTGMLRVLADPVWLRRFLGFAPMGRMALTNYLSQSLLLTWAFYHHGLGLSGKVGPSLALVIITAFYSLQIAWSQWWLARFKFGPAEWLWRSMTYGTWQPFRLQSPPPTSTSIQTEGAL